jgi:hypothetical protein
MKKRIRLSPSGYITVAGLIAATAGVIIQIVSGASYPAVPPVFFILLIPAGLIAFGRWRWTPLIAVVGGLFLIIGLFLSGASVRMLDPNKFGVSAGLWIQMMGVVVSIVAGIIATIQNYQSRTL